MTVSKRIEFSLLRGTYSTLAINYVLLMLSFKYFMATYYTRDFLRQLPGTINDIGPDSESIIGFMAKAMLPLYTCR